MDSVSFAVEHKDAEESLSAEVQVVLRGPSTLSRVRGPQTHVSLTIPVEGIVKLLGKRKGTLMLDQTTL